LQALSVTLPDQRLCTAEVSRFARRRTIRELRVWATLVAACVSIMILTAYRSGAFAATLLPSGALAATLLCSGAFAAT